MATPVDLTDQVKKPSAIPPQLLAAIAAGATGGDNSAPPSLGLPSSPPAGSVYPAEHFNDPETPPPPAPHVNEDGSTVGPPYMPQEIQKRLVGSPTGSMSLAPEKTAGPDLAPLASAAPPPAPIMKAMGNSTNEQSLAAEPLATPAVKPPGFLDKLKAHLPDIIRDFGIAGGAMEAAGEGPFHEPVGAQMFQRAEEGAANRALEAKKIQNEAEYRKALASQYGMVPAGVDANGNPIYMQQKDIGRYRGTEANVEGRENVQGLKNTGGLAIAALRAGAPMTIDPELAQLANQPQLAGKAVSGATLQSFVKVLGARGIHIQDLGEEGLWAVDKDGHRIRQVSVHSPSVDRASAYARARAEYTPADVFDENGNLTSISQLQQLQSGVPKAQTVFGEQGPTAATRNMSQLAATVQPHLDTLRQEITELAPYLGPVMGRWNEFTAGKIGSTGNPVLDQKMGRLISDYKLAASAVGRTHFAGRTGLPAAEYFGQLFNMARSPDEMLGILQSVPSYIEGYAQMTNFTPSKVAASAPARNKPKASAPPAPPANRPPLTSFEH